MLVVVIVTMMMMMMMMMMMILILRPQDWYYILMIYCVHWSSKWHGNPQPMMNPWLRGPNDFPVSMLSVTYIQSVARKRKAEHGRILSICHQCEKSTNETWCPTLFFSTPSSNPAQIQLSPFPPATPACQLWWFSWATWTPFFNPELPSKFGVARCYHISGQTSSFPLIRKPIHFSKAKQKWER